MVGEVDVMAVVLVEAGGSASSNLRSAPFSAAVKHSLLSFQAKIEPEAPSTRPYSCDHLIGC